MSNYFWFCLFVLINSTILFVLTANVSRLRLKLKISLGDGGNKDMLNAIRAQCNSVEQIPIYALMVLALSLLQTSSMILAGLTLSFSFARICHAYGMLFKVFPARRIGASLTYLLQLVAILILALKIFV